MDENSSGFFKTYYILMIIFAIIGLTDSFLTYFAKSLVEYIIWSVITSLLSLGVFILSIIAVIKFTKNQFSKITLVIPIFHIAYPVFLLIIGIIWGIMSVASGNLINPQTIPVWLILIGIVSSLFELVFSGYILNKFK
ncbi:MAG: hypothetical protein KC550_03530 [Nanoarchaeota archaeon]|nr:hypothetical protein [Nanoarchaeota archaeon]